MSAVSAQDIIIRSDDDGLELTVLLDVLSEIADVARLVDPPISGRWFDGLDRENLN